jgi:D-alanine-D-alanine ligase
VSVASGLAVISGLEQAGHELTAAYIDRDGSWHSVEVEGVLPSDADPGEWALSDPWSLLTASGTAPRVVMAVLHGPCGEDGVIAALAQLAGVACVGSGMLASALCMDKTAAGDVLDARGIAQTPWLGIHPGSTLPSYEEAAERLGSTTLFVKPANLGSSIGITRVTEATGWGPALSQALGYDDTLIVEAAVEGRELSVSMLGNRADGYEVSEVSETKPHGAFLDHADKYGDGAAMAQVPAGIDADLRDRVRATAPVVADALRVDGIARVDLFLTVEGQLLVNEVNTMPGFTAASTFPRMWAAAGVEFPDLLDRVCALAIRRHQRARLRTDAGVPRAAQHAAEVEEAADHSENSGAVTVRDATVGDWVRIGELTVAAYAAVPGRPWMPEYDSVLADTEARAGRATLLVAEDAAGRVVGSVGYSPVAGTDGRVGRARQVAVDPEARGQGVGSALMIEVMNRLRAGGAAEMVERTADYMTGAQALYRSLDFRRAPEWDEVQRDGPPLLAFRRHL